MRLPVGERILVALVFAPESGFLASWFTALIMEGPLERRPAESLLWAVGLSVFAVVACLVWYLTGRSHRNTSERGSRTETDSTWVAEESGGSCGGGSCGSGGD